MDFWQAAQGFRVDTNRPERAGIEGLIRQIQAVTRRRFPEVDDINEIVSETLVRCCTNFPQFNPARAQLNTWVCLMALNPIKAARKRQQRQDWDVPENTAAPEIDPDVQRVLDQLLPDGQHTVRHFAEVLSTSTLSATSTDWGVPVETLKAWRSEIRDMLSGLLGD